MLRSRRIYALKALALVNVCAVGNPDTIGDPDIAPWKFVVRVFDRRGGLAQERRLVGVVGAAQ